MNRINLLISRVMDDARTPDGRFTGMSVVVRDGYTPLDADPEGRPTFIALRMTTKWDADAVNNIGRRGASVVDVDAARVSGAVADLLCAWGDVPVQDSSGRFPHLATAPGVLRI